MSAPRIRAGQIWESRDKRDRGKRIRIVEAPDVPHGYVTAECCRHPERPHLVGRPTRISYWCLPDYYRLVEDAAGSPSGSEVTS